MDLAVLSAEEVMAAEARTLGDVFKEIMAICLDGLSFFVVLYKIPQRYIFFCANIQTFANKAV